jgi:hypothetical protein
MSRIEFYWSSYAAKRVLLLSAALVTAYCLGTGQEITTKAMKPPLVLIAELEIDPAQVEAYKTALKEEIAAYEAHLQTSHFQSIKGRHKGW